MPRYDYSCTNCGHLIEVIHRIDEPGPRFCPNCGAEGTMRKAIVAPSFHFKGSGWAKKDRASAGRSAASKATADQGGDGAKAPKKDAEAAAPSSGAGSSSATASSQGSGGDSGSGSGGDSPSGSGSTRSRGGESKTASKSAGDGGAS